MSQTKFHEPIRTDLSPRLSTNQSLAQGVIRAKQHRELSGSKLTPSNYPELSSYLLTIPHVTKALVTSVNNYAILDSHLTSSPNPPHRH